MYSLSGDGVVRQAEAGTGQPVTDHGMAFTVADGVGGQNAGEIASELVAAGIAEELGRFSSSAAPLPSRECGDRLETALRRTNGRVRQESAGDPSRQNMAATASVLWLIGDRAIFGHVGDSRIYRFRGDSIQQMSHDHSAIGRAVRTGQMSEEEGKLNAHKSVLDQAMGVREEVLAPEIDWLELLPGDLFLLCSDGLVDRLQDRDLASGIQKSVARGASLSDTADALLKLGLDSESRDNITLLLVRVTGAAAGESRNRQGFSRRGMGSIAGIIGLIAGCLVGFGAATVWSRLGAPPPAPVVDVGAYEQQIAELRTQISELRNLLGATHERVEEAERMLDEVQHPDRSAVPEDALPAPSVAREDLDRRLQEVADVLNEIRDQLRAHSGPL